MDEKDNILKNLWTNIRKKGSDFKSKYCPGDRILSQYSDETLRPDEKERVENHLLECEYCLALVHSHKRSANAEAYAVFPDVPLSLKEKTKRLISTHIKERSTALLDIILKFAKDAVEVISNPGNLAVSYGPMPAPVRSGNRIMSPDLIILSKTFSDIESEVKVERVDDRHVNMKIRTVDIDSRAPVRILRVSLLNPVRELASYVTDDGEVSFGNLNYGEYAIKLIRDREEIGQISLNITLNAN
ncbi:MAG: zf-HC2 domain-containing protein [Nitrospirota bacterium]